MTETRILYSIIDKITDEHESEKINRNEPIENDIAEYISYDYEYRSIYIAGLKIFEEFGTDEFGYSNEGSARIINDEKIIDLSDERIVEIGKYFREFILEIESKLDYFTYEN